MLRQIRIDMTVRDSPHNNVAILRAVPTQDYLRIGWVFNWRHRAWNRCLSRALRLCEGPQGVWLEVVAVGRPPDPAACPAAGLAPCM